MSKMFFCERKLCAQTRGKPRCDPPLGSQCSNVFYIKLQLVSDIFDLNYHQLSHIIVEVQTSILNAYDWEMEGFGRMVLVTESIGVTSIGRDNRVKKTGPSFYKWN